MADEAVHAERLTVYCTEATRFDGKPFYEWLIRAAFERGLHGATAHKALAGFGQHHHLHHQHLLSLNDDLPVVVELIDTTDRIEAFLNAFGDLLGPRTYVRESVHWHPPR